MARNIQKPISIPEPTNDPDSLWRSTQALKETVEMMQGIRGNREYALKCDLDDVGDTVTSVVSGGGYLHPNHSGEVTSSGDGAQTVEPIAISNKTLAIPETDDMVLFWDSTDAALKKADASNFISSTFFALNDTNLSTQARYDLAFNIDGAEWRNTAGDLQWNPTGKTLQLANDHSINWVGNDTTSKELLILENTPGSSVPAPSSEVILLMHFDGTQDSRTFRDYSEWSNHGKNAGSGTGRELTVLSTIQSKFGGSSLFVEGASGSHVRIFTSPEFTYGTNNWTIEWWSRPNSITVDEAVFADTFSSTGIIQCFKNPSNQLSLVIRDGTATIDVGPILWPSGDGVGVWGHNALVRDGDLLRFFHDGVEKTPTSSAAMPASYDMLAVPDNRYALRIGDYNLDSGTAFSYDGYFDEFKITNGTAVYTTNFTPPTAPFADPVIETGDPYFESVTMQCNFDGADGATTVSNQGNGADPVFISTAAITDNVSVNGETSFSGSGADDIVMVYDNGNDGVDEFGTGDFTLEFWVNNNALGANSVLASRWVTSVLAKSSYKFVNTGGVTAFYSDGTTEHQSSAAAGLTAKQWFHLALCRDGDNMYFYRDGVVGGAFTGGAPPANFAMPYETTDAKGVLAGQYIFGTTDYRNTCLANFDSLRITKGACRYPGGISFNPVPVELPEALVFAGSDAFIVGDPTIDTQIDGLTTNITSAATDIDGTLNVDGVVTVSSTVDGRDVALDGTNQDTHIADATIHFTEASIDHTAVTNIGTTSHADIDTHIADATIHFTEAAIALSTTTALEDGSNAINTDATKEAGYQVFNTTTGAPVWAIGDADGSLWNNATGATAHTPIKSASGALSLGELTASGTVTVTP